ncbi:related to Deoxyribose-phosphate aldolase [Ramularia collo-cygni]|uniref:deoxyribose-phosphate aldolase n=1 Tax=Ramularia collo-cygni TaxID=112498 RepID=A0A2D3V4T6_9PEZI|nr:related to Deoxyribose-phosphate aldolase [Ramularia collo-cygni]CZT15293.1 related to Deoxyribose-phosphate aldolase [Ramularia collo-cygni]
MAAPSFDSSWSTLISTFTSNLTVDTNKSYSHPALEGNSAALNKTVDHTLLKLDATEAQFEQLYAEAAEFDFATVCVRPPHVASAVKALEGTAVGVASVVGFHEGTYSTEHKLAEAKESIDAGASELDVVLNFPQLIAGEYAAVCTELQTIRSTTRGTTLKLILETSQLNREQIIAACVIAGYAGFDFVKTSTGFNGAGASEENVRLMKACCEQLHAQGVGEKLMKVKASGGVRTLNDAKIMLGAGAERLGTSGGVTIAKEGKEGKSSAGGSSSADY